MSAGEPSPWCYWLAPGSILAGCYPGHREPERQREKLESLLTAGARVFVNLMEVDERDERRRLFAGYEEPLAEIARAHGVEARCLRFPIRDLDVPTRPEMTRILDALDEALESGGVYLHCRGGLGRTGTVAACWLLRRGLVTGEDVIERLTGLRCTDGRQGSRYSPETPSQLRFVEEWARRLG